MSVLWSTGILCWVVFVAWSWLRTRHCSPPAYPGALPIIGHAYRIIGDRKHLYKFVQKVSKYCIENGGIIRLWTIGHTCYVITDPDDILEVSNACLNKAYFYNFAKTLFNNGLITSDASTWKIHRKILNPVFNQQVINTFVDEMNVQSQHLISLLAAEVGKAPFDVRPYFVKHTLRLVSRTSLGLDVQDQRVINEEYAKSIEDFIALTCERLQRVWLYWSFLYERSALKYKQDELTKTIRKVMNPVIKKRKLKLESKKISGQIHESAEEKFEPALNLMLNLAEKHELFTEDDIREHLDSLLAAAYDTSSSTMTYVLLMIGKHQDVQERICNELQEVFEHKHVDITKDDLKKMVFLEAVIKETLRLYAPVPAVARVAETDVKLKNYTLPCGSIFFLYLHGACRHPMWGADADTFRPERWLDPTSLQDNPNAFAAFSLGKRNCIGKLYAMMTMKMTLAHVLRRYYITSDIRNLESEFDFVIKPVEGHLISLKLRS